MGNVLPDDPDYTMLAQPHGYLCIHMCTDMCTDMWSDMWTDMCTGMYKHVCNLLLLPSLSVSEGIRLIPQHRQSCVNACVRASCVHACVCVRLRGCERACTVLTRLSSQCLVEETLWIDDLIDPFQSPVHTSIHMSTHVSIHMTTHISMPHDCTHGYAHAASWIRP